MKKRNFLVLCVTIDILLLPFSVVLGGYLFYEWLNIKPPANSELTTGTVIERELVKLKISKRPRLTIQINNAPEKVHAILSLDGIEKLPDTVTFYYSGEPREEVHLLEEANPLIYALFFFFAPILLLVFILHQLKTDANEKKEKNSGTEKNE